MTYAESINHNAKQCKGIHWEHFLCTGKSDKENPSIWEDDAYWNERQRRRMEAKKVNESKSNG